MHMHMHGAHVRAAWPRTSSGVTKGPTPRIEPGPYLASRLRGLRSSPPPMEASAFVAPASTA